MPLSIISIRNCVVFLFVNFFFYDYCSGQLKDLPVIHDTLHSAIIGEKRPLEIVLPDGYHADGPEKYEVLYITDGEYTTKIVSSFVQFLGLQFLPPIIVVSVPNTSLKGVGHRERDMLPTHIDQVPLSGGADHFLGFFKKELVPYIEKKYACNGSRTLYGSSFAGVFTLYALLNEPQLFQSYLLADPALWWDNGALLKMAKEKLRVPADSTINLLITGRHGQPFQGMGIAGIDSILASKALPGLRWRVNVYSDETHNSMIFRTVYDGLKFVYHGYSKEALEFHPMNGILVKDRPIQVRYFADLLTEVHFTVDGAAPTLQSPRIDSGIITLDAPAALTMTSFCNRPQYNKTTTGFFKAGQTFVPASKIKNAKPGGLHYTYYEGAWNTMPDLKKQKPIRSGIAGKDFDLAKMSNGKEFVLVMDGQLEIAADGYYVFGLNSGGIAKVTIGDHVIFDVDSLPSEPVFRSYVVPLAKGFYPVQISYFQKKGNPSLELIYAAPGHPGLEFNSIAPETEYSSN